MALKADSRGAAGHKQEVSPLATKMRKCLARVYFEIRPFSPYRNHFHRNTAGHRVIEFRRTKEWEGKGASLSLHQGMNVHV